MAGNLMAGVAGGATVAIVIKGIDQFSSSFKNAQSSMQKLGNIAKITAVGMGTLLAVSAKQAASFERTKISFEVMLGSAEKSKKMLADLVEFSKKTPFKLTELEENSRLLLGMGIEADDLIDTMKSLGDVSAGLNLPFERLALNFGQVKARGQLMGTELRDFARGGVPIIQELSKNLNIAESDIKRMSSEGKISFKDVEEAFRTMTSEGGIFDNLMSRSMGTLEGGVSNLMDGLQKLARSLGEPLLKPLTYVTNKITDLVSKINELPAGTRKAITVGAVGVTGVAAGIAVLAKLRGQTAATPMYVKEVGVGGIGKGGAAAAGGATAMAVKTAASTTAMAIVGSGALMAALPAVVVKILDPILGLTASSEKAKLKGITFKEPQEIIDAREKAKQDLFGFGEGGFGGVGRSAIATAIPKADEEIVPVAQARQELSTLTNEQLTELKDVMNAERQRTELLEQSRIQIEENGVVSAETTFAIEENIRALATEREEARAAGVSLGDFSTVIKEFALATLEGEKLTAHALALKKFGYGSDAEAFSSSSGRGGSAQAWTGQAAEIKHAQFTAAAQARDNRKGKLTNQPDYGDSAESKSNVALVTEGEHAGTYARKDMIVNNFYNQVNPTTVAQDISTAMQNNGVQI